MINFANDLDIADDGKIYFTEASSKWGRGDYLHDLLETTPYGRLLMYDPATRITSVLMDGMYFANGVALSTDERYLLVTETWRYGIMRYWLKGDKAGTSARFMGNLPGFPAGISNHNNHFWLSLITLRNPVMDKTHETPWLKDALAKLPEFLTPGPIPYGLVLKVKETGPIESSLHDVGGKVIQGISSAVEKDGYLYFGTFKGDRVGRYKLAEDTPL
ncbi:MAG: SMP-30/gluconolactonase/LRE family protein [Dokdonia sp.]|nr:SMP-30/gluconolactonase/LRE family protein [Dokdonia sp.]